MSETEGSACLLYLLNRLVVALEQPPIADLVPGARRDAVPERWQDQEYVYLEANLPDAVEEIDISFHGNMVFIRIVR